jgi:hypothetical protein
MTFALTIFELILKIFRFVRVSKDHLKVNKTGRNGLFHHFIYAKVYSDP